VNSWAVARFLPSSDQVRSGANWVTTRPNEFPHLSPDTAAYRRRFRARRCEIGAADTGRLGRL